MFGHHLVLESMKLGAGSRIGPFKVETLIGKGGMGEVFSAVDTRLNRKVALKSLPGEFATDIQRLERFQIEARTLASLNHPNILSIFEIGAEGGNPYLITELLEGETLRDQLKRGAIAPRKVMDYSLQIAEGMAAAHENGVIHRDLKPENIFVLKNGHVKILDFGLAKLLEGVSENATTVVHPTSIGVVLGTVGYMSPEQVTGGKADHRSDIFAFGCILYEMVSGRRAFRKETNAETMTAILNEEPPEMMEPNQPAFAGLDRLVLRCLEKQPDRRFQSTSDLAFALESLLGSSTGSRAIQAANPARQGSVLVWAGVPVALLGVLWAFSLFGGRSRPSLPEKAPTEWRGERLGGPSVAYWPVASPDGKEIAFPVMDQGLTQVGHMSVDSGDWTYLTTDRDQGGVSAVSWSRDGTEVFYDRWIGNPRGVYRISKLSRTIRMVLADAGNPLVLPDDSLLVTCVTTNRAMQIHHYRPGYPLKPLNAFGNNTWLGLVYRILQGGKTVLFHGWPDSATDGPPALWTLDLEAEHARPVLYQKTSESLDWLFFTLATRLPDNRIYFADAAGNAVRVKASNWQSSAPPRTLFSLSMPVAGLDVTEDGSMFLSQYARPTEILRITNSNQVERIVTAGTDYSPEVLPLPGDRLLFQDVLVGRPRILVTEGGREAVPFVETQEESKAPCAMLGPDKVLCRIGSGSDLTVAIVNASDGRIVDRVRSIPANDDRLQLAGSPDGKTIYYVAQRTVWAVPVEGGEARRLRDGDSIATDPGGEYLVIQVKNPNGVSLVRLPLNGAPESPIAVKSTYALSMAPLGPNAVRADGKIAVSVAPTDSWFWPVAIIDPDTGELELASPLQADMEGSGWDNEGRLVTLGRFLRATLWRFRPEK